MMDRTVKLLVLGKVIHPFREVLPSEISGNGNDFKVEAGVATFRRIFEIENSTLARHDCLDEEGKLTLTRLKAGLSHLEHVLGPSVDLELEAAKQIADEVLKNVREVDNRPLE